MSLFSLLLLSSVSFASPPPADVYCRSSDVIDAGYFVALYDESLAEIGAITYLRNYAVRREAVTLKFPDSSCKEMLVELTEPREGLKFSWRVELRESSKGDIAMELEGIPIPSLFRKLECDFRREGALPEFRTQCEEAHRLPGSFEYL